MHTARSLEKMIELLAHSLEDNENRYIEATELSLLSKSQIHYLDSIQHLEHPTLSELSKYLGIAKPTCTLAIEKLEEKGYVTKVQSDFDRRSSHLHLTEAGRRMAELHDAAYLDYAKNFRNALNAEELEQFLNSMEKVLQYTGSK